MPRGWWGTHPTWLSGPLYERLWDRVNGPWVEGVEWDDCWLFTGAWRSRYGYGRIRATNGRPAQIHVIVFEQFWGKLAPEHILRHACDVPLCCNPWHLAPGTIAQNHRDMWDKEYAWACTPLGVPPRWAA